MSYTVGSFMRTDRCCVCNAESQCIEFRMNRMPLHDLVGQSQSRKIIAACKRCILQRALITRRDAYIMIWETAERIAILYNDTFDGSVAFQEYLKNLLSG